MSHHQTVDIPQTLLVLGVFIALLIGIGYTLLPRKKRAIAKRPSLWYHVHAHDEVSGE